MEAERKKIDNYEKKLGLLMASILLLVIAIIFIWYPTHESWLGIPLATVLMFVSWFVFTIQSILYVLILEKKEKDL